MRILATKGREKPARAMPLAGRQLGLGVVEAERKRGEDREHVLPTITFCVVYL
jgi:hypothetical protein